MVQTNLNSVYNPAVLTNGTTTVSAQYKFKLHQSDSATPPPSDPRCVEWSMATPLSAKTARLLRPVSIADDPTASNAYRSNANLFSDSPSHAPIRLDLAEIDRSPVPVQTVATSPMTQKRLSTDVGVQSEQEPAPGARVLPMASIVAEVICITVSQGGIDGSELMIFTNRRRD